MADKLKKYSQAIRLGATFHPQCFRNLKKWRMNEVIATCAIGAATEACGIATNSTSDAISKLMERFPGTPREIFEFSLRMNDTMPQITSREQIADWVASQGY